jgi:hypothetical protein
VLCRPIFSSSRRRCGRGRVVLFRGGVVVVVVVVDPRTTTATTTTIATQSWILCDGKVLRLVEVEKGAEAAADAAEPFPGIDPSRYWGRLQDKCDQSAEEDREEDSGGEESSPDAADAFVVEALFAVSIRVTTQATWSAVYATRGAHHGVAEPLRDCDGHTHSVLCSQTMAGSPSSGVTEGFKSQLCYFANILRGRVRYR